MTYHKCNHLYLLCNYPILLPNLIDVENDIEAKQLVSMHAGAGAEIRIHTVLQVFLCFGP